MSQSATRVNRFRHLQSDATPPRSSLPNRFCQQRLASPGAAVFPRPPPRARPRAQQCGRAGAVGLAKARRHLAVAVAGDGHTLLVFSAVRRDIFVEPQPKQNFSPGGAAYLEDVAPNGALAVNKLLFYKDASPTGLSHHTDAGNGRGLPARVPMASR